MMIYRILLGAMLSVCLAGCVSQQSVGSVEIIEGCMVRINGISTTQADDIIKDWNIDPGCQVEVNTEIE